MLQYLYREGEKAHRRRNLETGDRDEKSTEESPAGNVASEKDGEYWGRQSQRHAHLFLSHLDCRDSSLQSFDILLCGK